MDNKAWAKIPNSFFYNEGELLKKIGGSNSLLIYLYLTSEKNMNDVIRTTINNINEDSIKNSNSTRGKEIIIKSLSMLKEQGLIQYDFIEVKGNERIEIKWINKFPDTKAGWIKFYSDDYELFYKVGKNPYLVSWILRMFRNGELKSSFVSMDKMATLLKCDKNIVQNTVNLFDETELFEVSKNGWVYSEQYKRKIKLNNNYYYQHWNLKNVLNMDDEEINNILYSQKTKQKECWGEKSPFEVDGKVTVEEDNYSIADGLNEFYSDNPIAQEQIFAKEEDIKTAYQLIDEEDLGLYSNDDIQDVMDKINSGVSPDTLGIEDLVIYDKYIKNKFERKLA